MMIKLMMKSKRSKPHGSVLVKANKMVRRTMWISKS